MVFSSSIFLFLFLPVFLGIYYLTPFKFRSWVILLGSYSFYAWWRVDFLLLFKAARFFNQAQYLPSYILSCFIYPFFSIYVTFISIFSSYKWKGRSFKK